MLYQNDIEVLENYEFVVCGGGMTGFACAVAAARKGLKTVIIEKLGCLGGVATSCGVTHLLGGMKYKDEDKKCKWYVGGIFKEISEILINNGDAINPDFIDRTLNPHGWIAGLADGVIFDIEKMKILLEKICRAAGVDIYYFTDIIDVCMVEDRLKHIIIHNKSGIFAIEGKYFADTTGDADIAHLCGCKTVKGRTEDDLMAPASLEMHVENVNTAILADYIQKTGEVRFKKLIAELRERGIWDFPYEIFISVQVLSEDTYMINTIRQTEIDGTDGKSLTKGMIEGRNECMKLFKIMKECFPGFKDSRLKFIAPMIGIRETRRIIGDYVLTVDDIINNAKFQDSIALSSYGWDLPDPKKPSYQPMHEKKIKKPEYLQIPYRCLLPNKTKNLIVAGRCISVERDVLGPVRVMAPCMAMGQAAGTASYLAHQNNTTYKDVDIDQLCYVLKNDNCYL